MPIPVPTMYIDVNTVWNFESKINETFKEIACIFCICGAANWNDNNFSLFTVGSREELIKYNS